MLIFTPCSYKKNAKFSVTRLRPADDRIDLLFSGRTSAHLDRWLLSRTYFGPATGPRRLPPPPLLSRSFPTNWSPEGRYATRERSPSTRTLLSAVGAAHRIRCPIRFISYRLPRRFFSTRRQLRRRDGVILKTIKLKKTKKNVYNNIAFIRLLI